MAVRGLPLPAAVAVFAEEKEGRDRLDICVNKVGDLERRLGIHDLAKFTIA